MLHTRREVVPFNQIQGVASTNVCAYSNGEDDFFPVERHYYHGIFLGFKWECIEFARRWLLMRKTCVFPNIPQAADLWEQLKTVERVTDGKQFPLQLHLNGSSEKPKRDSLLVYPRSSELPYGHIAIICDVIPGYIRVAEQNYEYYNWSDDYSREIRLIFENNSYFIDDEHDVCGWMEIENSKQLEPLDEGKLDHILQQYQQTDPIGTLERCTIPNKTSSQFSLSWLNENDPAEKLFSDVYTEDLIRRDTNTFPYYKADQDLLLNIASASNNLHQMFLHATDYVLQSDDLLRHFCIPEIFWSKIRQSWLTEKDLPMTGRFDLAFNGKQIKLFEYNADSAAALFEMSVILEKWAQVVNFERTFMSGFQLHRTLVRHWKRFETIPRVHILIDEDQEELMTGYYMQHVLKDANIESKICILTKDLFWKDSKIVDNEGNNVQLVWKLWMWETVFSNYLQCQKDGNLDQQINGEHPYLHQILLNNQIKVIEPLWKVITSNKALLPILWYLYPNHPHLLRSEYELSDDLKQVAFVKKPIVGRCGHNVTLYDVNGESVIDETRGKFIDRNCIYQELFSLTKFDGYYPILGSWIVKDAFAGFGIREDKKLITDAESPVTACSIILK